MKRYLVLAFIVMAFTACTKQEAQQPTAPVETQAQTQASPAPEASPTAQASPAAAQ